jgi:hypothetical protein
MSHTTSWAYIHYIFRQLITIFTAYRFPHLDFVSLKHMNAVVNAICDGDIFIQYNISGRRDSVDAVGLRIILESAILSPCWG